jgi:2-polyprenyl-3-methyl-5-hydroxy-6-metoxy-1,4-benzoquinol methylase
VLENGYYANARQDIVDALPRPIGSALDVGCGSGAVGARLRAAGATRLTGVEIVPEQAELARAHYDVVLAEPVEQALEKLEGPFDTILCLDVLEHLVDPERVMAALRELAAPGARLQVSLPNARHVSLMRDLIFRGTFGYTQWGHRDKTHLRWFTKRDIVDAMTDSGWAVQRVSHPALNRSRQLDRVTRGRSTEFLVGQWYVLGVNTGGAGAPAPLSSSAVAQPG